MNKHCNIFLTKTTAQRGAMFGLDARLTIAILAAISIVVGASMAQVMKDRRTDNLLFEQEKISSAVSAIQEDLRTNIHESLTTSNDENAYMALIDGSLIKPGAENRWLGPYLRNDTSNNHREFGEKFLVTKKEDISNTCTQAEIRSRECLYYYKITSVPLTLINSVNEQLDGAETTPENEGAVQWDTITANDATLHMRLGLVAP